MLLGLINAEKAQKLLMEDIEDQKEMEDYYYYPAVNNRGDTLDIVRLNSATKLASSTVFKLTVGTAIAVVYLLVCLGLFAGVVKNRANFIVPWMIFDVIVSLINNSILVIIGTSMLYERFDISEWLYCKLKLLPILSIKNYCYRFVPGSFCIVYTIVDLCTWFVVFNYYSIIKQMSKLREEAVIKCPAPIVTPYPYYRDSMFESDNGLRHTLFEPDQLDYVA
jgi:hypothetical protein